MYSLQNRQFVFRQAQDKLWNFFYDNEQGICFSIYSKNGKWSYPQSINKHADKIFCADMDDENNFHILLQDNSGSLIYYYISNNGHIESIPVLGSKSPTVYDKKLCIIPMKNTVHLFYLLKHNNGHILSHQQIIDGKPVNPRVVDYVAYGAYPCSIVGDRSSNLYAFYQLSDKENVQLGYKKYMQGQKNWSEFVAMPKQATIGEFPKVIIDANNIVHLCYQRKTPRQYELVYQQKVPDKNIWSSESLIYGSTVSFDQAAILWTSAKIYIFWVREDSIFYSASSDGGSTWNRPSKYNFQYSKQLVCISYKSNLESDFGKLVAPYIPASFVNGLSMAFNNTVIESNNKEVSTEQFKAIIAGNLKNLEETLEDLTVGQKSTKEDLIKISNTLSELEKETTKTALKYGMLESQASQIKQLSAKVEDLKAATVNQNSVLSAQIEELKEIIYSKLNINDDG